MQSTLSILLASCVALGSIGCSSSNSSFGSSSKHGSLFGRGHHLSKGYARHVRSVRTTAYSHQEADSLKYGTRSATGNNLKYGNHVRSAAADWSVYPVGTMFRIVGEPHLYEVDDYGSALVGTETIDIYKPTLSSMRAWGVRNVNIEIVHWGSFARSLTILEPRTTKASHVRSMVRSIQNKT